MVVINCYKIHQSLNITDPKPTDHRRFTEDLVNLLFLQQIKGFAETITIKPYPKYTRKRPEPGPKTLSITLDDTQVTNHSYIRQDKYRDCYICRD
jgi:hypothetical protein